MIYRNRRLPPRLSSRGREALTLVLLYAGFSALWILLSDRIVYWLLEDSAQLVLVGAIKGWVFVAVTSVLLFVLLRRRSTPLEPPATLTFEKPRREMLWALAVLMLVIVAVTALSISHNYNSEKRKVAAQLQAIASSKSEQLWDWHLERMSDAMGVQNNPDLNIHWNAWRLTGQEQHRDSLQQHLRSLLIGAHYARVLLLDANGIQLQHTDYQPPANDPYLQEAFLSLLSDRQPRRVGPWIDPAGVLRLAFMAPVGLDGPFPAAVVLHTDPPEAFHPVLQTWPLPHRSAETLLLKRDGTDVLFLNALRHDAGGPMSKRLSLADHDTVATRFLNGRQAPGSLAEGPDYRGVEALAVAQQVGQSDWWLLVRQDRSELMTSAVVSGLWMALAGLLALFAAGVAVYLYEQRRRLMRSAHDIDELRHIRDALAESEARYRLLAENGSDVVWLLDVQSRRLLYISPSVEKLRGYSVAEVMQHSLAELFTSESLTLAEHEIDRRLAALQAGDESARTTTNELTQHHRDGHLIHTEIVSTFVTDPDGRIRVLQGVTRDITARKQAEAQILRLSQATEQSPASVVITGLDARIEYVNSAFERISGYRREDVLGQNPRLLQSGMTPHESYTAMWKALQAGQSWSGEIIDRHKSGRDYLQTVTIAPVRDDKGTVTHYLSVQLDITAQRRAEEKAHELAWFDPLTGLPNRHRLLSALHDTLGSDARSGYQSALLLLNINRFKTINDALGHSAGDVLLQRIVERLSGLVAPSDLLARLGADEFAMLLFDPDHNAETISTQSLRMAEALHASLDQPFSLTGGESINVTASIGVTLLPMEKQDSPGEVLRRADTALHRAKGSSGRQTAFFDATMGEVVSQRFAIEQDLRRGLSAGELRLFLQPQVNAQGRIVSAEALVRWQHPERGLVPPGLFIPVAEESHLITEVGGWVLRQVCLLLGRLHQQGLRLPMAVNVSPRQFHQPDFLSLVMNTLADTGASPNDLVLEITEGIVIEQLDTVVRKMSQLTQHGVKFSIDDFGTGYSSLAYLKRLPIHELKIDRSFVQDAPNNPSDGALVEAILSVAHHLQLKVVAEGVETAEQAAFLNARGQVIHQGYLFGRPEPAEDLLARWQATQP